MILPNLDSIMTVSHAFAKSELAVLRDQDNKEAGVNPALFPQLYLVSPQNVTGKFREGFCNTAKTRKSGDLPLMSSALATGIVASAGSPQRRPDCSFRTFSCGFSRRSSDGHH